MSHAYVSYALTLLVALTASATDLRSGLIPNWLTFPALLLGPGIAAAYSGVPGLALSGLGVLIAGGAALAMYALGGLGGGDVKLFAALAGLSGPRVGLEIELFALCWVLVVGCGKLRARKQLSASWQACARVLVGAVFLPHAQPHELTHVRMGFAIFGGTLLALAKQLA